DSRGRNNRTDGRINIGGTDMNTDLISSFKLMGMGMAAIFTVILIIYLAVWIMLRVTGSREEEKDVTGQ
ncbi:MAG: OadG-related small transporter subunit, partial [Bacteroidales bacterium]